MTKKPPDTSDSREDVEPCTDTGAPEEDDSIQIVEVVGVEEDGPRRSGSDPMRAVPTQEDERQIPYSQKELYDLLLRKQAEFENAKKRLDREREDARRRIWADLLRRMLPVLDNFHSALTESTPASPESFRQGIALTFQQMRDALIREGLEEIGAVGERFDPHLHEAVETRCAEGFEEGMVLEELRKGYLFQGQLLRPALVRVSAKGAKVIPGEET